MKALVFGLSLTLAAGTAAAVTSPVSSSSAPPSRVAHLDAFSASGGLSRTAVAAAAERRLAGQHSALGYASRFDALRGAPSFLWPAATTPRLVVGALQADLLPESLGRAYLGQQAARLGLDRQAIREARATDAQRLRSGAALARFQQRVDGIDVFQRSLNVLTDRDGRLIAISGSFHGPRSVAGRYSLGSTEAISRAIGDRGGHLDAGLFTAFEQRGDYEWFASARADGDYRLARAVRVKRVYYPQAAGLEPAYYVELFGGPAGQSQRDALAYVVSADSGRLLFRSDLRAYEGGTTAFSYRVFADADGEHRPDDAPLGNGYLPFPGSSINQELPRTSAATRLVTLVSGPISTGDAWLPDGATTTTGNHVDAFLDSSTQLAVPVNLPAGGELTGDGYLPGTGDVRAELSGPNAFDYPLAADDDPSSPDAQQAAIVNLFYLNNWLHDWWYDHGFNEAAGNAQSLNYGRGGAEGDPISAQGQDGSGRNNANMATPGDGSSPTMQMYRFDGPIKGETCQQSPAANCASSGDGSGYKMAGASFGPQVFDVTGEAVVANDGSDPVTNGCNEALSIPDPTGLGVVPGVPSVPDPNLLGKIALIDRGSCNFTTKEQFAMLSGARALVVINNGDGDPSSMGNADIPINVGVGTDALYTVPAVMIRKDAGDALKAQIASGQSVQLRVQRLASIDYDGTLDNLVIAHEYFHYVSNRLVGDGSGLGNNQGGGMGEGWGDISSMMLAVREDDRRVAGNDRYQGAYPTGFYVIPAYYFGIRRMPYSYDFARNSLTFKHIQDGVALGNVEASQGQVAAPAAFGTDGATNSEVHNTGEVWANMLFNVYVNLLNVPGRSFAEAQSRMKDYIVCGLKMTPSSPTFLDARDAVLACTAARDAVDFNAAARAFARRGIGLDAAGPPSDSTDNVGVTESYVALEASAPTLNPGIGSGDPVLDACDQDGVLDAGESGRLSFTLVNNGGYAPGQTLSGTLASTTGALSFPDGRRLSFTAGAIGQAAPASVIAALAGGVSGVTPVNLTLTLDTPADADPAVRYPQTVSASFIANADVRRNAARDGFDYPALSTPDWAVTSTGTTQTWAISDQSATTGSGNAWFAPDLGSAATLALVTPSLSVPAGSRFTFAFDHAFDFEADLLAQYDGGVIEVSVDGGAWTDAATFGATFSGGYNATLQANNRRGYGGASAGVLHETLDFGSLLAGHSVRLRFVLVSDALGGGTGWSVDNVVVSGAGTPFAAVTADDGVCVVDSGPNHAPSAALSARPTSGTAPLTVTLDASASADSDGDALVYVFNFGDGSEIVTQATPTVSHVYTAVGSYAASVTVRDPDNASASASTTIGVLATPPASNRVPNASLSATPATGEIPLAVSFDASGSYDLDGDAIVEYRFDFGDGSPVLSGTAATASHRYEAAGSFVATVVVRDSRGALSSAAQVTIAPTTSVVVTPPGATGPVAALTVSPRSGTAPLVVNFDGSRSFDRSGGRITLYIFDFGDGSPLLSQSNPVAVHTYTTAGTYAPSLQVKNSAGEVSAKTLVGTVKASAPTSADGSTPGSGSASGGRSGGGALDPALLLPLLGLALLRRRGRRGD